MPPDMRSYPSVPVPDDTRGETASSGYASSGYASVQGTEKHSSPADETHTFESKTQHSHSEANYFDEVMKSYNIT